MVKIKSQWEIKSILHSAHARLTRHRKECPQNDYLCSEYYFPLEVKVKGQYQVKTKRDGSITRILETRIKTAPFTTRMAGENGFPMDMGIIFEKNMGMGMDMDS